MKKNAHIVGGVLFGLYANHFVVPHIPFYHTFHVSNAEFLASTVFFVGSLFGSLLPDIDHQGSYLGRRLKPISFIVSTTMGHRGATHSLLVNIVVSVLFSWAVHLFISGDSQLFLLTFLLGCLTGASSHLFLDSLTVSGIPLLYPLTDKHFRLATLKTGGVGEKLVIGIMVFFIFILIKTNASSWISGIGTS